MNHTDLTTQIFTTRTPEETALLGEHIGQKLKAGSIVALNGALGMGKTCLTQGIARALRVEEPVTSPTYTVVNEYKAIDKNGTALPFYHIDAYRLSGEDDFAALGGEEYLYGNGICVIEWAERLASLLPENVLTIEITPEGEETRTIRCR
ncbi:MAG: tRNA (adenosine(37)-N6)-threonylcarbamoyltransferase complex ATPase subunit type 1 TsaE [Spirochaetaceae bacterium]|jgi:tRNA threonylcarbamoyladenosine biosynthesis protein TsaE|nr:tRNA (adenosine(37)-N6)-threonylcarbamoyltransferase complex ATPase subunit type 1 TsaE [Spirochaetaceae bacterium]